MTRSSYSGDFSWKSWRNYILYKNMNGTKIPPNFVLQLSSAKTSEAERHLLEELKRELLPLDTTCVSAVESEEDLFEKEFLTYAKATFDSDNPFPSKSPENLFSEEDDLNSFTCYLFERRYGWSEIGKDGSRRVRRLSCGGVLPSGSVEHKAIINDILDDFLKWYSQQPLTARLLKSCLYTLSQVSNVPVVRNQAYIHLMGWFKRQTREISSNTDIFTLVKTTVVSGVTDVWSAIRSACASRLGPVCAELPPSHLYQLFTQLSQICQSDSSPWQSVEGAIMGLNAVIKGFRWKDLCDDGTSEHELKGSCKVESNLSILRAVSGQVKEVVYPLLSHPQLTIREHATRTLSSFLSRNQFQESLSCFEQVCHRLCQGTEPFLSDQKLQRVHHAALHPDYKFLDAYAAEGLLSVVLLLVKRIPVGYLVPRWPHYLSTFLLYLMHPASTVRQATSSVFKYILSRGSTNPVFVKLVISELVKDWTPDVDSLGQSEDSNLKKSAMARRSVTQRTEKLSLAELSSSWEWREGRLFAYELIMKFLIKNHWLYTFGLAGQSASTDRQTNIQADKEQAAREKLTRRISEVTMSAEGNDCLEKSSEYTLAAGQQKHRVMTSDALVPNIKPSSSHGRPYPQHTRSHDPHGSSRNTVGLSSVLAQLNKLENTFPQNEGVYQNEPAASEKQRSILLEMVQNKEPIGWLCDISVEPTWCLLEHLFYQVSDCVADGQWELRRMGIQTLPCLSELIRWYDMPQLVWLITTHLNTLGPSPHPTSSPSPLTYTAVLTLRDLLVHAASLQHLLRNPPPVWQEQDRCKDAIVAICAHTQENVESYLPVVQQLLTRGSFDKLSVIAANVLKLAVSHFHLSKSQKSGSTDCVLQFWRRLFCLAHPNAHFTPELKGENKLLPFQSPYSGYLSCCVVRPEGPLACAKQVYGVYLRECHGCLVPFVSTLSPQESAFLLPVLAHGTSRFAGDPGICKLILDSLSHLSSLTVDSVIKEDCSFQRDGIRYIYLALKEITSQITSKTLDLQIVRRLLDIYLTLSKAIVLNKHLPTLLRAICARINQSNSFMVQVSPRPADDLAILSNDIPPSTQPDVDSEDSDAEDTGPVVMFPECFSLNMSNNSGSFTSGRLSALSTHSSLAEGRVLTPASSVQSDAEQDSDWDSWSEEEEDASAIMTLFTDFFAKLRSKSAGSSSIFSAEMDKLGEADKKVMVSILGQIK